MTLKAKLDPTPSPHGLYKMSEAGRLAQEQIESAKIQNESGIFERVTIGIPEMDRLMLPFLGGELVTILGRPGHGKSLLAQYIFHNHVNKLKVDRIKGESLQKYAVWVSWEVSVEVFAMYMIARETGISVTDMKRGNVTSDHMKLIADGILKINGLPVYIIGHSIQRQKVYKRIPLTTGRVDAALAYIINNEQDIESGENVQISLVVMDYLQLIESDGLKKDRQFYQDTIEWCKRAVQPLGCPNIVPTQARREVDNRRIRQPTKQDAEETSRVEHVSDCQMSVCIPATYPDLLGEEIDWYKAWGVPTFRAEKGIMFANSIKQKDVESNLVFPLRIEPQFLKIESTTLRPAR